MGSAGPTSSASMRVKYDKNIFLPAYLLDIVKRYGKIIASPDRDSDDRRR